MAILAESWQMERRHSLYFPEGKEIRLRHSTSVAGKCLHFV